MCPSAFVAVVRIDANPVTTSEEALRQSLTSTRLIRLRATDACDAGSPKGENMGIDELFE
jgi:hypothetical protein